MFYLEKSTFLLAGVLLLIVGNVKSASASSDPRFIDEARRVLANLEQTDYQLDVKVDEASGTYDLDCSELVGYLLSRVSPGALADVRAKAEEIEGRPTRDYPQAIDYTMFFSALDTGRITSTLWEAVPRVPQIQAGDVIAWKHPEASHGNHPSTGHMMIALGSPTPSISRPGEWIMLVMDSTSSRHGTGDSREAGETGVGTGTIALEVDSFGRPTAYRWSTESPFTWATPIAIGRVAGPSGGD